MASGLNLKVAQKAYNSVKKDIATLDDYINEFRKNVVILNETIWYGGKAADTWYASANKAYAADCKFRDKLINIQNRLATKIDKTIAASGGKDRVIKMSASSGGGGSVGGSGAVASYSSGGSVSGSGSTGGSASGTNSTSGKPASRKMSNEEQERANRENTSKAIENTKKSRAVAQQNDSGMVAAKEASKGSTKPPLVDNNNDGRFKSKSELKQEKNQINVKLFKTRYGTPEHDILEKDAEIVKEQLKRMK